MSFQDKSIQCSDCGTTFTFSAREQEQFASRGYTNEPKVVPHVARQGKHGSTETVATAMAMTATATHPDARCSLQYAPIVARKLKYRSSPVRADRCIVAIATVKSK